MRGPNYRNADVALIKHTRIGERADLEFLVEVFNLTNTPAFGQPNCVLGSAAFATITSTASYPRVLQFGFEGEFLRASRRRLFDAHIGVHNAYHIGQMVYVRKEQGSWDPEKGVK